MQTSQCAFMRVVTGPTQEPVTVSEARAHLRIDHTDEDSLLVQYIQAARELVEQDAQLALMPQTLALYLDNFVSESIELRRVPIVSVDSISYYDTSNASQTLATSVYDTDLKAVPPVVSLKVSQSWPTVYDRENAVTITCTAGYTSAASVPAVAKQAILLLVGHWYRNRDAVAGSMTYEVQLSYDAMVSRLMWGNYA